VGSLPFPGAFTLFKAVPPAGLGTHSYTRPRGDEASRGTVYTCGAGFLDLAHVRFTIDWTRYVRDRVRDQLRAGPGSLDIEGMDDTDYEVSLRPPAAWPELDERERAAVQDAAALQVGQRVALLMGAWHEILTYNGYKTTGVLSEKRSAFTYDDLASHVVGVQVADAALRQTDLSYDLAVTRVLDTRLRQLKIVDLDCMHEAVARVRGMWWEDGDAIAHQVPSGMRGGSLAPLVVQGLGCCEAPAPAPLQLPAIDSGIAEIVLHSRYARRLKLSQRIDRGPPRARFTEADVEQLLSRIEAELAAAP